MNETIRDRTDYRSALGAPTPLDEFNRAGVLDPIDVRSATTMARVFGEADPTVVLAAALAVRGTRFGHVCVELPTIRDAVAVDGVPTVTVDALPWPDPEGWLESVAASPLNGSGSDDHPLVVADGRLYLQRYWDYELEVAANIEARMDGHRFEGGDLSEPLHRLFGGDAGRQRLAAAVAAANRFTVISGGPGTGKTFTISGIIGLLNELATDGPAPQIAVAAPTGKAAARLTEQIRAFADTADLSDHVRERVRSVEASTLHRLLGWHHQRGRFSHGATDPLAFDTVIVDEMSMVSLPIAAKLLDAIDRTARVVLVGDPDQLVSIEAGSVLGDLVGPAVSAIRLDGASRDRLEQITGDSISGTGDGGLGNHVIALDRGFRFDPRSVHGELADAIRGGDADRAIGLLEAGHDQVSWIDTTGRAVEDISALSETMLSHAERLIALGEAGDAEAALTQLSGLAVLCAHRRGELGVEYWAPWIERRSRPPGESSGRWYPGLPVMITTNEYRLGVFNGDLGVTVRQGDRLAVAFPGADGPRLIGPAQLPSWEPAHAVTIHKSQGSQFEQVIVLVPGEESRLLTRELLYTAATRAVDSVTVAGTEAAIRAAIDRRVVRASGLGDRLWR